jgi:predicted DNA-binding transcriptional regulator AlpA
MILEHPDPLLTDKEAASILRISVATFWRWKANGLIKKPVKLGGLSRWPRSEIFALLDKARADARADETPAA